MKVTAHDQEILRVLAKKQKAYATSERNKKNEEEWYRHHRFEEGRPMIHIELDTFQQELIPPRLECETEIGRKIEEGIYKQILNYELFEDDRVVPEYFPIQWQTWFHLFGLVVEVTTVGNGAGSDLGHRFNHVIKNLSESMPNLKASTYGVDREETLAYKNIVEEVIGDILPVEITGGCLSAVPTQQLVHLMGMENMFMSMYDSPDLFKELMDRIADDYISFYRFLEEEQLLLETTANQHLGQGSFCYNNVLPSDKGTYLSEDLWGFMDSQETVGVSPEMYGEFIFPCYKKIAKEFGLLSYGCCEPVNSIWDDYLATLSNLRKVSISPWCDETFMGERLAGKKVVYHRKPSPNFLGVDVTLDEEAVRAHIKRTVEAARGCQLEFAQRDVYTIHNNPEKVKRYVQIIREECQ